MVEFLQYLGQEWKVIGGAPFTFAIALLLAGAVIWAVLKGINAGTESALRERLSFKDDQLIEYKEKLAGASPEEAKQLISALERRILELEPPSISEDHRKAMGLILQRTPGRVSIFREMGSANLAKLHSQLSSLFKEAGWQVTNGTGMDMNFEPATNVTVTSPSKVAPAFQALDEALRVASIAYSFVQDETYVDQITGEPTLSIRLAEDALKMDSWLLSA